MIERRVADGLVGSFTGQTLLMVQEERGVLQAAMQDGQLADSERHRAQVSRETKCVRRWSNGAVEEKRGLEEAGLRWSRFPNAWDCAGRRQLSAAVQQ